MKIEYILFYGYVIFHCLDALGLFNHFHIDEHSNAFQTSALLENTATNTLYIPECLRALRLLSNYEK